MGIDAAQSPASTAELLDRLAAAEQENARLRAAVGGSDGASPSPGRRRRGWWRAALSALCIVLASATVAVSIIGAWARVQLVDETQFVATFGPLAADPAVQDLVVDQTTAAIDEAVDLEGLTDDLFDGIAGLDLPPRAVAALELLRAPAAQGVQSLVDMTVTRLVESEAFAAVWETALRASHRGLVAVASGGTADGALAVSADGEVGIQLAPIIEEVKARLADSGLAFADSIPVIDRTIIVAQSDALAIVAAVYGIAVTAGAWLPFVTLGLFLIGVLVARRRVLALIGSGVGLALGAGVLAAGLAVGGTIAALTAVRLDVPAAALTAVYDAVASGARQTAGVLMVLGVALAVVAWTQGSSRPARAIRATMADLNAGVRRTLVAHGGDTGRVGDWFLAQRVLVRVVLVVLALLWLLALRPLTIGDVVVVVLVSLVVWWACELVQRAPAAPEPAASEPAVP